MIPMHSKSDRNHTIFSQITPVKIRLNPWTEKFSWYDVQIVSIVFDILLEMNSIELGSLLDTYSVARSSCFCLELQTSFSFNLPDAISENKVNENVFSCEAHLHSS